MKKLPQRTCIGCNSKKDKNELLRIVKNKNAEIYIDLKGKMEGRGIYLCKNIQCLEKALKSKKIARTFETQIPDSIYDNLKEIINGGEFIG